MRYTEMVEVTGQDIFEELGQIGQFTPGQMISECGATANKLFYIREGQVRAFLLNPEGEEITLFYINAGGLCCLESLVAHPQYIVNIETVSEVTVFTISPEIFLREWVARGYSIKDLLSHFVRRILLLSDYLCCTRFHKSISRLAYILHTTYTDSRSPIYFTHDEIAGLTGMSTITVDRCLKKLEEDGAIQCGYHRINIINEKKLPEYFSHIGYGMD